MLSQQWLISAERGGEDGKDLLELMCWRGVCIGGNWQMPLNLSLIEYSKYSQHTSN